jgi:hypothetical protein
MRYCLDHKLIAIVFACLLSAMLMLSCRSTPPSVPISQLKSLESGSVISIVGLVISKWCPDSGAYTLVLMDPIDGSRAKVVSSEGSSKQPLSTLSIGDEVCVLGEVSQGPTSPTVFAARMGISLLRESEAVLDVQIVCQNWNAFENDRINLTGTLEPGNEDVSAYLVDEKNDVTLPVFKTQQSPPLQFDKEVRLDCTLVLDSSRMRFILLVWCCTAVG